MTNCLEVDFQSSLGIVSILLQRASGLSHRHEKQHTLKLTGKCLYRRICKRGYRGGIQSQVNLFERPFRLDGELWSALVKRDLFAERLAEQKKSHLHLGFRGGVCERTGETVELGLNRIEGGQSN